VLRIDYEVEQTLVKVAALSLCQVLAFINTSYVMEPTPKSLPKRGLGRIPIP
jgi:hypothetical protein